MLRSLIRSWLVNAAKAKARDTVVQAAQQQLRQTAGAGTPVVASEPKPCQVGIVFALGIESGCLEDRLEGCVTIQGDGFRAREGGIKGQRAVVILSGAGRKHAARATDVLIDGHRPDWVISAGFAGGLSASLKRHDILLANRVILADGSELAVQLSARVAAFADRPGVHTGALLCTDHVVRLPNVKRLLHERHGAQAVDMETFAVAEVCRRREMPFVSVRVIHDAADEALSKEVENLIAQKTGAARLGAALGAVLQRPGSVKDMYRLRENALVAADRLAKFLIEMIGP